MSAVKRRWWLLPETPDVLGMLDAQFEATLAGVTELARWTTEAGAPDAALAVRDAEHEADDRKLELRRALRASFSTPLDSEDLYMISERLDNVINEAKDLVREAELMEVTPDRPLIEMAEQVVEGVALLRSAVAHVLSDPDQATRQADAATKCQRHMEKAYRAATAELMRDDGELRLLFARRESYERMLRVGGHMVSVSERVWYAVVKES